MRAGVLTTVCIKITNTQGMTQCSLVADTPKIETASFFDMLVPIYQIRGWNIVVSIATRYGLDGSGFKPQC
jgi:hypothetical protein